MTDEQIKLGYVDVERHIRMRDHGVYLKVLFNGVDVTNHCEAADDLAGYVDLFKVNADGQHYVNELNELARERLYGDVRFEAID